MKRDMELIRKILLNMETGKSNDSVEGYTADVLRYHQALVIEAGFASGKVLADHERPTEIPAAVHLVQLTWEGHKFIEAIESETTWNKVKAYLQDAGKQLTIDTIKTAITQLFR